MYPFGLGQLPYQNHNQITGKPACFSHCSTSPTQIQLFDFFDLHSTASTLLWDPLWGSKCQQSGTGDRKGEKGSPVCSRLFDYKNTHQNDPKQRPCTKLFGEQHFAA